jgi:hypothetical protein
VTQCSLYMSHYVLRHGTDMVSPVSLVPVVVALKALSITNLPGNHGGN